MQIRTFQADLQDQAIAFFQEMWGVLGRRWSLNVDQDMFNIPQSYQKEGEEFWLAMQDNCVVGTAGLRRLDAQTSEFKRFYVHPDFQSQGIGSTLLSLAIEKAKHEGYLRIRLDTKRGSQAMKMFVRLGFVEIEPYYNSVFAEVFMELLL